MPNWPLTLVGSSSEHPSKHKAFCCHRMKVPGRRKAAHFSKLSGFVSKKSSNLTNYESRTDE